MRDGESGRGRGRGRDVGRRGRCLPLLRLHTPKVAHLASSMLLPCFLVCLLSQRSLMDVLSGLATIFTMAFRWASSSDTSARIAAAMVAESGWPFSWPRMVMARV